MWKLSLKPGKYPDCLPNCGLSYDSEIWLRDWSRIMENVIAGCKQNGCKLVYLTIPMPIRKTARSKRKKQHYYTEKKGRGKKMAAELLLKAIATKEIEV
jgi:hypothetical protein